MENWLALQLIVLLILLIRIYLNKPILRKTQSAFPVLTSLDPHPSPQGSKDLLNLRIVVDSTGGDMSEHTDDDGPFPLTMMRFQAIEG